MAGRSKLSPRYDMMARAVDHPRWTRSAWHLNAHRHMAGKSTRRCAVRSSSAAFERIVKQLRRPHLPLRHQDALDGPGRDSRNVFTLHTPGRQVSSDQERSSPRTKTGISATTGEGSVALKPASPAFTTPQSANQAYAPDHPARGDVRSPSAFGRISRRRWAGESHPTCAARSVDPR